ncbi:hypothetical protein CHS0354_017524 [Potamilus streckersoni]|uniref:Mitochondrial-processing peptidase subunit alpha n=1 Tax=Potamilus streckersoni TaxID=2493646 RepID=A0AAE0VQZ3_9BIVA|nr:hypothetical protein CHS0354_017524 [Potamilus streckersoni]
MATRVWNRIIQHSGRLSRRPVQRGFSSASSPVSITDVPLSKPLPGVLPPKYTSPSEQKNETQVTTLNNGLRVASENKFGQFCTVGVLIDSGSRYEVAYPSGISHFFEKLAFGKTSRFANRDTILQELERHGGICDCQGSRDTLVYAMSAETHGLPTVLEILSEVVLRPEFTDQELEDARTAIGFELEALKMNPNPEPLLMEMIHRAAYKDNTLGLPKFCPTENLQSINRSVLYTYSKHFHSPERMVLAGVGVEHEKLVKLAEEIFLRKTPIWEENKKIIDPSKGSDSSLAQYTGGTEKVEADLSDVSLGPTAMPELAHFVIGLESCSHKDSDFVAFCVLNMMMGGGGSFSAGGPGKGMYTRLYLNVLNRHHWIHNATAYNHAYSDSGLFCIHSSAHPDKLRDLVEVILLELVNTTGSIHPEELNRAKTQLQSMLLMNLEARPVVFEDVGRQVLSTNCRQQPEYYYEQIAKITEKDIIRVAERILQSKPSVAAYGNLSRFPALPEIQSALLNKSGRVSRRFSIFR